MDDVCSGNGVCDDGAYGDGVCTCDHFFEGADCSVSERHMPVWILGLVMSLGGFCVLLAIGAGIVAFLRRPRRKDRQYRKLANPPPTLSFDGDAP